MISRLSQALIFGDKIPKWEGKGREEILYPG